MPMLRLRKATEGIEKGNFDIRVDVKGEDEIGKLGNTFNRMAQTLGILFDEKTRRMRELDDHRKELLALADASNVILAATTYETICDIAVRNFGLKMAWLGFVDEGRGMREEGRSYEVRPVAYAGLEEGYLKKVRISWDDSPIDVLCPVGIAIIIK